MTIFDGYAGVSTPYGREFAKVIAEVWADPGKMKNFIDHPKQFLEDRGIITRGLVQPDQAISVVVNTEKVYYLVVPEQPKDDRGIITNQEELAQRARDNFPYMTA